MVPTGGTVVLPNGLGKSVKVLVIASGNLIKTAEEALAPRGRVLVRYSGTEPKVRILMEGRDAALLEKHADAVAEALAAAIGA